MIINNLKNIAIDHIPNGIYPIISTLYWISHPGKSTKIVITKRDCWEVRTPTEKYYTLKNKHLIDRGSQFWQQKKLNRYSKEGFVEIERGDTVLDVGAFLGEFSLPAAEKADQVIAVEPDIRTFKCLNRQVNKINNIRTKNTLFSNSSGKNMFKMAEDPTESSLINVDRTSYVEKEVQTVRIDEFLNENNYDKIDFMKMDAEGAEQELIQGMTNANIQKVAIDAGSERRGENTISEVQNLLKQQSYELCVDDEIVFGRK